jgi:hypothetical protein
MTSSYLSTGAGDGHAAASPPRPGAGVLLTVNPTMGFSFNAPRKSETFKHNFRPFLSALGLRISYGTVGAIEPTIGDTPASKGTPAAKGARMSQSILKLNPSEVNADGESWACVEVEPNEQGLLTAKTRVEVIHTKAPNDFTPTRAREPLVLIVWRKANPVRIEPIRQWCMQYYRIQESATFYRHVFL